MKSPELRKNLEDYYKKADIKYLNWGRDEEREGVYALHCGFNLEDKNQSHYDEVKEHTRQILDYSGAKQGELFLDAGCGTGAISFEAASRGVRMVGINILRGQLERARKYNETLGSDLRAEFLMQDYHVYGFRDEAFDGVIFGESYIHSDNKEKLAQEACRVLKRMGVITVADVFLKRDPVSNEEERMLEEVMDGWYMPTMLKVDQFKKILIINGFDQVESCDVTENILPSTKRMRENAEERLSENDGMLDGAIGRSRLAVVSGNELMKRGVTQYCFVRGRRNEDRG